jgi:hypothetical protein
MRLKIEEWKLRYVALFIFCIFVAGIIAESLIEKYVK